MNLILNKSAYVKYYTYLTNLFSKIEEFQEFDWVISGYETNCYIPEFGNDEVVRINGIKLLQALARMEYEPQFIWGVLTGFESGKVPHREAWPIPYKNSRYWDENVGPEVPGAICEIICIDSSLTLFVGVSDLIGDKLRNLYPDIKNHG